MSKPKPLPDDMPTRAEIMEKYRGLCMKALHTRIDVVFTEISDESFTSTYEAVMRGIDAMLDADEWLEEFYEAL